MSKRMKPAARKNELIEAGLKLAQRKGFSKVTRDDIAAAVGVTGTAVQYHFNTMAQLRTAIMRRAVKTENLPVVAQGIVAMHPCAVRAPAELKDAALNALK